MRVLKSLPVQSAALLGGRDRINAQRAGPVGGRRAGGQTADIGRSRAGSRNLLTFPIRSHKSKTTRLAGGFAFMWMPGGHSPARQCAAKCSRTAAYSPSPRRSTCTSKPSRVSTDFQLSSSSPARSFFAWSPATTISGASVTRRTCRCRSRLRQRQVRRVTLAPLMVVAGDHAKNDLAGDDEDSWKSVLTRDGFEVQVDLRGLGEYAAVREHFAAHCLAGE